MIKHIERLMYDKVAATAVEYALIAGGLSAVGIRHLGAPAIV
jgi:Flp pilus assembly pilin Flp